MWIKPPNPSEMFHKKTINNILPNKSNLYQINFCLYKTIKKVRFHIILYLIDKLYVVIKIRHFKYLFIFNIFLS